MAKEIKLRIGESNKLKELEPLHMVLVYMADNKHNIKFPVSKEMLKETKAKHFSYLYAPIQELCLDGRCENIMIRAGMHTIHDIILKREVLSQIKGAGKGSVNKIMHSLCEYMYIHLPNRKAKNEYLRRIIELNLQEA